MGGALRLPRVLLMEEDPQVNYHEATSLDLSQDERINVSQRQHRGAQIKGEPPTKSEPPMKSEPRMKSERRMKSEAQDLMPFFS